MQMKKTTIAPTAELATPRVEKFIREKAVPYLQGTLEKFYLCDPATMDVETADHKEHWVEGCWGAHIICDSWTSECEYELNHMSNSINVNDATIHAAPENKLDVSLWLSARVMR